MKIVCDSCATKYSISDDKVRGKVFKIRCKKCSHIIVVRGTNDGGGVAANQPPPAADGDGGWHLVVDGDQVGPLPDADVRARISRGEVNGETYVWKDGFADWIKLSTVPEFADEAISSPAAETPGAEAESEHFTETNGASESSAAEVVHAASPTNSGGLFGSISVAPAISEERGAHDPMGFSAPSPGPDLGGGDLFAAQASPRPSTEENHWGNGNGGGISAGHDGGRLESLTAQRHENSVLFSLSNLQSLAAPGASAKPAPSGGGTPSPGSEGSGLIDIRAMAASTLGSPGDGPMGNGDDLPSFGAFSPAAPVLLSLPTSSGPPKWIYAGIVLMVALVGVILLMAWKIFSDKPPVLAEPTPASVSAPVAAAPAAAVKPSETATAPTTPQPSIPDDKLPPREAPKSGVAAAPTTAAHPGKHGKGGRHGVVASADPSGGGRSATAAGSPAVAPAADPTEKKPTKGSLDDLLEGALSPKAPKASKLRGDDDSRKAVAEPAASGPLSKNAVVAGMNSVKGKVGDCYNQYKVPGMVMVNVVIGKSGRVSSATAQGKFAGTPSGNCVEKAVKSAAFPPSDGLTTPYPFILK
ncbi:MAG TPA: GYF domain-containing protein [Polyangia bacterium]|jgi:predicted Zn finger-like uncharacterized protein|nr:GYF domain-containing protein [Polyangia bacterium]